MEKPHRNQWAHKIFLYLLLSLSVLIPQPPIISVYPDDFTSRKWLLQWRHKTKKKHGSSSQDGSCCHVRRCIWRNIESKLDVRPQASRQGCYGMPLGGIMSFERSKCVNKKFNSFIWQESFKVWGIHLSTRHKTWVFSSFPYHFKYGIQIFLRMLWHQNTTF